MGSVSTITHDKFPTQGDLVGKSVRVCFHFNMNSGLKGTCVRDDMEPPWVTIFQLENGRFVLATECQYSEA